MPKRKLRLEEIEVIILDHDVTQRGTLRKNYKGHISRKAVRNGLPGKPACKAEGKMRWAYPFRWGMSDHLRLCGSCVLILAEHLENCELKNGKLSPASNTGVNSVSEGG